MDKENEILIINCRSCLVNNYLVKGFFLIEKDSEQLRILTNDAKLRIHEIDKLETYFVMAKETAI